MSDGIKIVEALERIARLIEQRMPLPVQISPRALLLRDTMGKDTEVVAAVYSMQHGRAVGVVRFGTTSTLLDTFVSFDTTRVAVDSPRHCASALEAARDLPHEYTQGSLRWVLIDMLQHGETERIVP